MAKQWAQLVAVMRMAVDAGLHGVAVLTPDGEPVGVEGALESREVRALAALVSRNGPPDLLRTLFDGELATTTFEHRTVFLGIAARCVFIVALAADGQRERRAAAERLRDGVDHVIREMRALQGADWIPPSSGSSGSGSAPAEAFAWLPGPKRQPN